MTGLTAKRCRSCPRGSGNGAIVPNGVLVEYARLPEKQALMISTMTAPQRNPDFRSRDLVYLDQRLVHHLRSFKMDTQYGLRRGLYVYQRIQSTGFNLVWLSLHWQGLTGCGRTPTLGW